MEERTSLVHDFNIRDKQLNKGGLFYNKWVSVFVVSMVLSGFISGYLLFSLKSSSLPELAQIGEDKIIKSDKVVGSTNTKVFKDSAEGILEKGGIDGEGTHHLVRKEGHPDQNAYLISSVIDLDKFVGKKVKVWGETFKGEKAGWLMDVGKLEIR